MFSNEEIYEVMAQEIGEFQEGVLQKGSPLINGHNVHGGAAHKPFLRRKQESRRFWPESETYPSVRHGFLIGETKADRYGDGQ